MNSKVPRLKGFCWKGYFRYDSMACTPIDIEITPSAPISQLGKETFVLLTFRVLACL